MRKDKVVSEVLGEEGALAPSDLYSQEFKRSVFGGLDRAQVTAFLERVADQLEGHLNQIRDLKQDNERLREDLSQYRQMEGTLRSALMSSQRFGEQVLETAKREAHTMLRDARVHKMEAELAAHNKSAELTLDIQRLREERRRLRIELLTTLESHKLLVDSLIPEDEPQLLMDLVDIDPEAKTLAIEASEAVQRAQALAESGGAVEDEPVLDDPRDPDAPPAIAELAEDTVEAVPPAPDNHVPSESADGELSEASRDSESG
ncbi:MAG: DivIVA domain-containing protein [bacterium]|nr:DivIVA domain-containing protein [bacterium]